MFGNARLGMVPAMHWAAWFDLGRRYLLFAHRDPGANFLDAVATLKRSDFGLDLNAPFVSDEVQLRITTEAAVPKAGE